MNENHQILSLLEIEAILQFFTFMGACVTAFYSGAGQRSSKERNEQTVKMEKYAMPTLLEKLEGIARIESELNTINEVIGEQLAETSTITKEVRNIQEQFSDFGHRNTSKLEGLSHKTQEILNNVKTIAESSR